MAKCQFCDDDIKEFDGEQAGYITTSMNKNGDDKFHIHVHGNNLEDKDITKQLIAAQILETGLGDTFRTKLPNQLDFTEVIFHNRQRIGDMLMFTCAIRDFKKAYPNIKVNVLSTAGHLWDNNPYIDRSVKPYYKNGKTLESIKAEDLLSGDTNVLKIGPSWLTDKSNSIDWHFANAYRISIEEHLKIKIPQGESRPDIWFTQDEYDAPRITEKPYWIIITGGEKGWGCKMYPTVRWQKFIDQNPDMTFYQLGSQGDNHERLKGPNVIDYIGKTEDRENGIRDLFKLFLNSEGSIGLVSFHMHLSGGLKKPCVVVAGAREPVSFTRYAGHQYISNDGCLPCATKACWHCDIAACTNLVDYNSKPVVLEKRLNEKAKMAPFVPDNLKDKLMPKCVDMISVDEVTRNFRRYYEGGLLDKTKPSKKPKVNIGISNAAAPVVLVAPKKVLGLEFNGGALTELDWEFINSAIKEHNVKTVLEFGGGLSTLLFNQPEVGLTKVVTYEDKPGWIKKILDINSSCDIRLWDGKQTLDNDHYDFAFVDGPANDQPRERSTYLASQQADVIVVHDAGREWARKYQEEFIAPDFDGPTRGGHRCHLWIRKGFKKNKPSLVTNKITIVPKQVAKATKTIKIVSTARGWGGCGRSITTLMKMLLKDGHKVEFIPFHKKIGSREFQECIKSELQGLTVTPDYSTIKDSCDIILIYADDFVWEFGNKNNPEVDETFSNIGASKKIMMLNYRSGSVGKTPWTKTFDKYMFLNNAQREALLKLMPGAKTSVLAPCTDLERFFSSTPKFDNMVHLIRHSSQGDVKFSKEFNTEVDDILSTRDDLDIHLMPAPSFAVPNPRIIAYQRNTPPIPEYLSNGNLFWYSLPKGYPDMGPRVIIEAMAAGLPVIADNWGGAVDRLTKECGWLCNEKSEYADIIRNISVSQLKKMGSAARQRAKDEFSTKKWISEIIG